MRPLMFCNMQVRWHAGDVDYSELFERHIDVGHGWQGRGDVVWPFNGVDYDAIWDTRPGLSEADARRAMKKFLSELTTAQRATGCSKRCKRRRRAVTVRRTRACPQCMMRGGTPESGGWCYPCDEERERDDERKRTAEAAPTPPSSSAPAEE